MASQMDLFALPTKPAPPAAAPVREPPTDPDAGPRQTVERLRHPTLGDVVAVRDNGPAYLRLADWSRVDVARITDGGASSARDGVRRDTRPRGQVVRLGELAVGEHAWLDLGTHWSLVARDDRRDA